MRIAILLLVSLLGGVAHAEVRHVPPAEATAGAPIEILAHVERAWESTLVLHYRGLDQATWQTAAFTRTDETGWRAVVPGEAVAWPGVAYYIDSAAEGEAAPRAEFASAERPHEVRIRRTRDERRRERDLARVGHRRSRVRVAAELVNYGDRDVATRGRIPDAYYRIDADFAYRLLAYPLEQIRFGYTRLLGHTPETPLDDPAMCTQSDDSDDCELRAGFKVGGWVELRLGVGDGVDLDARGMVMATNAGFGVGGRAELRFGVEDANHVALGVEGIQEIGSSLHFRLGWATVPRLPMAATVEVTDMPSSARAAGVRFVYDVAYPAAPGVRVGGRIGYQARDADVGGVSAGASAVFDF